MAQRVKKASACNAGDRVRSLSWEDPLEKEMATHSSILAWKIPWTEEPGRLQSMGSQKSRTQLSDFTYLLTYSEGRASQVALVVKNPLSSAEDTRLKFDSWVKKIPWRRAWQPSLVFLPGESH